MKPLTATLLASALATLALAACSGRVLDYRNMTVSGGKIYAQNSDTPFSGKVANVPFTQTVPLTGAFGYVRSIAINASDASLDTIGIVGNTVCDLAVKDGYRNGAATCRDGRTGTKYYELSFANGRIEGDIRVYSAYSDGKPIATGTIGDKGIDGTVQAFSAKDHALVYKGKFTDGVNQSSEDYYPDSGKLKRTYVIRAGRAQGPIVEYSQEGKRISYTDTTKGDNFGTAAYQFYPETGKLKSCSTGLEAWTFIWNEDGKLIKTPNPIDIYSFKNAFRHCRNNLPPNTPEAEQIARDLDSLLSKSASAATSPDPLRPEGVVAAINGEDRTDWPKEDNACTQAWESAFRKENGTGAVINYEMAWEWVDNCRAGKRPH